MSSSRPEPLVLVKMNSPWAQSIGDEGVRNIFLRAAREGEALIADLIERGDVQPDASFAQVVFNPTCPRGVLTVGGRVIVVILYGDRKTALRDHLAKAVSMTEVADRTGYSSADMRDGASFSIADSDSVQGSVAMFYRLAVSGGCGLPMSLGEALVSSVLEEALVEIDGRLQQWLGLSDEERSARGRDSSTYSPVQQDAVVINEYAWLGAGEIKDELRDLALELDKV